MRREKKKTTERPWRSCPPVQAGAWAGKWRLLQFRKSGGPGVILLLADVKPSSSRGEGSSPFLVSQGSGQGSGCSRSRYAWWRSDWPGGLRDLWDLYMNIPLQSGTDGNPATVITKGIISSISLSLSLPKWGDHHALQTTSTYPVSEQNKAVLTAWSSKASAEVCPPLLTNAHQLLLSGQVSNTTELHGKASNHLETHLLLLLPAPRLGWGHL